MAALNLIWMGKSPLRSKTRTKRFCSTLTCHLGWGPTSISATGPERRLSEPPWELSTQAVAVRVKMAWSSASSPDSLKSWSVTAGGGGGDDAGVFRTGTRGAGRQRARGGIFGFLISFRILG